ncbi:MULTISPECIES: ABA4-like family protein [unclassified Chamaesiphon]|uniref:ABA4-like family protein n=1 Tax=unclassified Chamaesiphon TaxID=2620921 RepID=UPI00286CA488|nr:MULTISPECIES: ABA4-like family protein [unclassified Chamaesiphon]
MLSQLFDAANLFVLPFWALMIVLPKWEITRKVISSPLPFITLAGLYVYLLVVAVNPESAAALANPKLADIARFFADEGAAAIGWVHFLVMDLFVGRYIYLEGQQKGIITIHSLILCLFFGPIGLLSHLITSAISDRLKKPTPTSEPV